MLWLSMASGSCYLAGFGWFQDRAARVVLRQLPYIDEAIDLGLSQKAVIAAYGDLLRVPGYESSLLEARGQGADVRLVYSALDAVKLAAGLDKPLVFLSVGFETTAPASALAVKKALEQRLNNFYILTAHRTMPEPMKLRF